MPFCHAIEDDLHTSNGTIHCIVHIESFVPVPADDSDNTLQHVQFLGWQFSFPPSGVGKEQ